MSPPDVPTVDEREALFYSLADLLEQHGTEAVLTALRDGLHAASEHVEHLPYEIWSGEAIDRFDRAGEFLKCAIGFAREAEELAPVSLADACRVLGES